MPKRSGSSLPGSRSSPATRNWFLGRPTDAGARGLLFISFQTSIFDQFEFLSSTWMNTTGNPQNADGDGHDLLVGQNPDDPQRIRTATLLTKQGATTTGHEITTGTGRQWVFATGGGYFFAPSLSTLSGVIAT